MVEGMLVLVACQLAGEVLVHALALPVPGPVAGLGLLFALLVWRPRGLLGASGGTGRVADALVANLSLLFVPAAVGIMRHGALIGDNLVAILASIVVSTTCALVVTALVFRWVAARVARP